MHEVGGTSVKIDTAPASCLLKPKTMKKLNKSEIVALAKKISGDLNKEYYDISDEIAQLNEQLINAKCRQVLKNKAGQFDEVLDLLCSMNIMSQYNYQDYRRQVAGMCQTTTKQIDELSARIEALKTKKKFKRVDWTSLQDEIILAQIDSKNLDEIIKRVKNSWYEKR